MDKLLRAGQFTKLALVEKQIKLNCLNYIISHCNSIKL